jgi:hypothetical protein
MFKKVGTFTGTAGSTIRAKLFNVGLITRLFAVVTANVTIGTATATVSRKGGHALFKKIKVTDFDGTDRVFTSGYHLWLRNSLRNKKSEVDGLPNVYNANTSLTASTTYGTGITMPQYQTAVGTGNTVFTLNIPLCRDLDAGDLRGILFAQTTVGELYASFDVDSTIYTNGDDDKVYSGGATTTATLNSVTIDLYQEYFLPQQVEGVLPIPMLDTMTVYELATVGFTTDNISAGQEKLISFPNARQVHGIYYSYRNAIALAGGTGAGATDLSQHRLIANGNNILTEYREPNTAYIEQRRALGTDFPIGTYFMDFARTPIQTNLYGNIQLGVTPGATVNAGANIEVSFESLYLKGAALAGFSQSG